MLAICLVCGHYDGNGNIITNTERYQLLPGSCTGHSDWPIKGFKPRVSIDVIIPTYKPAMQPAGSLPIDVSFDRATIAKRLDRMERMKDAVMLEDINLGPFPEASKGPKCSYCGVEVSHFNMTEGTGKPRKIIKDKVTILDDKTEWEQTVIHVTDKLIACNECALRLPKTKFVQFD